MPDRAAHKRKSRRRLAIFGFALAMLAAYVLAAYVGAGLPGQDDGLRPAQDGPFANPIGHSESEHDRTPGRILFSESFELDGFDGWYLQSLPRRASVRSSDPYAGDRAARFEVKAGDEEPDTGSERSEVSGPTFSEGQDLYIRDAIRIPARNSYSVPWQMVQQLHEVEWEGSPGLAVFLDERPALKLGSGDSSRIFWRSSTLEKGRWYELTYRVYLSRNPRRGFVEVWLDGVPQVLANGQTRMRGRTIQADETYIKAGIYRSHYSTGRSIVEHDAIAIGTSLAALGIAQPRP